MPKFLISETIHSEKVKTVRLGTDTIANSGGYTDKETGKPVKLTAESRYALCDAGDLIEGVVSSINVGSYDGYSIGGMVDQGYKEVTFDGLQATPGTGVLAIGDYVVAGTPVAAGTALSGPMKVCKATIQPGVTEAADAAAVNDHIKAAKFMWRVASLGSAGTGAVGTTGIIERV